MSPNHSSEKEIIYLQPAFPSSQMDGEIDLVGLCKTIWQGKWIITGLTLLTLLVAGFIAYFVLPVSYQSSAVLSPIKKQGGASGGLSSLLSSLAIPVSLPSSGDKNSIMNFLQSRTLKERLIQKFDLLPILYSEIWDPATKRWKVEEQREKPTVIKAIQSRVLDDLYKISIDKETELITIGWISQDPALCSVMISRIIDELRYFLENEYITDAKRERIFVESQLEKSTKELEYWEQQIPSEAVTLTKITRERLATATVYTELRKQLELAKISEARENITFKVLDPPFVPEKAFKPKRMLILIMAGVLGILLSTLFVLVRKAVQTTHSAAETVNSRPHA